MSLTTGVPTRGQQPFPRQLPELPQKGCLALPPPPASVPQADPVSPLLRSQRQSLSQSGVSGLRKSPDVTSGEALAGSVPRQALHKICSSQVTFPDMECHGHPGWHNLFPQSPPHACVCAGALAQPCPRPAGIPEPQGRKEAPQECRGDFAVTFVPCGAAVTSFHANQLLGKRWVVVSRAWALDMGVLDLTK
jgi:hypothetical protein